MFYNFNKIKLNFYNILILDIILTIIGVLVIYYLVYVNKKCFITNSSRKLQNENIKTLVRQAARWSTAAEQDESPLISVLHANYGTGYLWALTDIATDDEIENATGINMNQFKNNIVKIQDNSTIKMIKLCPSYAPKSSYLTSIGGEGI